MSDRRVKSGVVNLCKTQPQGRGKVCHIRPPILVLHLLPVFCGLCVRYFVTLGESLCCSACCTAAAICGRVCDQSNCKNARPCQQCVLPDAMLPGQDNVSTPGRKQESAASCGSGALGNLRPLQAAGCQIQLCAQCLRQVLVTYRHLKLFW